MPQPAMTHLERRKIEAGVLVPMVKAFQRALGKAKANEIAREVVLDLARADGARWAAQHGGDLAGLAAVAQVWAGGGGLEITDAERSADGFEFKVTRCRYAEFFKELGLAELGVLIHCDRDGAMLEGFSGDLALTRTQTIMQGASHCDFHFERRK